LKLNANISMLFQEFVFFERFKAAAKHGFKGVEFLFPYDFDKNKIQEHLETHALQLVLFNMPPGDWKNGERGMACNPKKVAEFQDSVGLAIEYATFLNCSKLHCMAGIKPTQIDTITLNETYKNNLRFAAREAKKKNITVLIEAINFYDMPNFFLNSSTTALNIIRDLNEPNLMFQYDIYHMQIMEGNLANTIKNNIESIGHFQLADNPGRHEPGTGEINYTYILELIRSLEYDGWVGCEYIPKNTTESSLAGIRPFL